MKTLSVNSHEALGSQVLRYFLSEKGRLKTFNAPLQTSPLKSKCTPETVDALTCFSHSVLPNRFRRLKISSTCRPSGSLTVTFAPSCINIQMMIKMSSVVRDFCRSEDSESLLECLPDCPPDVCHPPLQRFPCPIVFY